MVFDILVAGSGNNLAAFLVALMTVFAALAGLMQVRRDWTPTLAQGGAMFAVAAPMLPAPDLSLAAMGTRKAPAIVRWETSLHDGANQSEHPVYAAGPK
jgi:hypothetical protein